MHKEELYQHSFPYAKAVKSEEAKTPKKRRNESAKASFTILKTGKITTPYAKLFKNLNNANLPPFFLNARIETDTLAARTIRNEPITTIRYVVFTLVGSP